MPKRTDSNQASIMADLRKLGASVLDLHEVGKGCPDLLVSWKGTHLLVEIKSGPKAKVSSDQKTFREKCMGPIQVAWETEQIVNWFMRFAIF